MWQLDAARGTGALAAWTGLDGTGRAHTACGCTSPDPQQATGYTNTHPSYTRHSEHTLTYCWCRAETFYLQSVIIWKPVYVDTVLTFCSVLLMADCAALFMKHLQLQ